MIDPTERVAIVGIGGVFPGAADPEAFWELIARGEDATTEIPPGRWRVRPEDCFDPEFGAADSVYATRGGFVDGVDVDPLDLRIDPEFLAGLDPMFHLALRAGQQAWRGARTESLDLSRVAVIFGNIVLPTETTSALARETLGNDFARAVTGGASAGEPAAAAPWNRHAAGLPAGLLAEALGLGGGAFTLDAACASSLHALRLASDSLLGGRADAVLAGGLSRPDPQYTQMGFAQLRALAPEGRARPFDARGGGLVVGEGAGMFLLKRLSDALRDGDAIHALVAAVGLSNDIDGGLLAPSSEGQLRAMRSAYEQAGWDPREVSLIECHATGTPVGDAVEFASLRALWGDSGWAPGCCVIGSHKANIGHALTASGAAGLLKVLLSLRHGVRPPTPNFTSPGPKLDYEGGPFRVLAGPRGELWPSVPGRPRRAAISGFGFGGINAHALIEEYIPGLAPSREALDPDREADPPAIAIVGVSAHVGPFHGLRAFQDRSLAGGAAAADLHLDALRLPLGRFRIPPKELEEMLPQQSLMLLTAADAAVDAGWSPSDGPRLRSGVLLGIGLDPNTSNFHVRWDVINQARDWYHEADFSESEWSHLIRELRAATGPPLNANRTMGALGGLIASRAAREFRAGGPSFTVSSEETSGLRALEVAVRWLRAGELDEAIVGAVDLTGDPRVLEAARRAGLGPIPRSDGAAALVLKRLEDAERDGNTIHAVIRGLGAASGLGLDRASVDLDRVEALAWEDAGLESASCGHVDRIGPERAGAGAAFGHSGAASGLIGLVRAAVSLRQEVLPPVPGTAIGPRYWLHDRADGPRRAQVTGWGVDGAGVSVLLEASTAERLEPDAARLDPLGAPGLGLFAVEADDVAGVLAKLDALEAMRSTASASSAEALARRWWARSPNDPSRRLGLAFAAKTLEDVRECLLEAREAARRGEGGARDRVWFRRDPLGRSGKAALVFPGIGNHFAGMGRELSARWPEVPRGMDAETLRLRGQLAPGAGWEHDLARDGVLTFPDQRAPIMGQVVLGTLTTDLLRLFGTRPDAVIGYSLGESSALFATRAWTERDAMHARLEASPLFRDELAGPCQAARRCWRLSDGEPAEWLAGIIPAPAEIVREALRGIPRAYLLIINAPGEVVVGGQRRAVERLAEACGGLFLPLPVVSTVHCEIARQVENEYRNLHLLMTTPPPGVTFYSAGWGRAYVPDRASAAEAIVAQAMDTVDFPAVIQRAYDDGVRVFIEAGPGASCTRMIRQILRGRPHMAHPVCVADEDAVSTLLGLLGRLIAERVPVDLAPLLGREARAEAIQAAPPPRELIVPAGVKPFRVPAGLTAARKTGQLVHVSEPETDQENLEVHEDPPKSAEAPTTVTASPASAPSPILKNGDISPLTTTDPLTRQVLATELSRGAAHESYLRTADGLSQTMGNHLSFQMALVEALLASPPAVTASPLGPPPALNREQCLEFAVGSIARVLGPEFAPADAYPTRVRLPDEPLMLVDRILSIEGEPRSMTHGRVVTEHDVLRDGWYLDQGKIPTCVAVEAGQADLFLSGYLGIDLVTKGLAVYRLLDATVIFHRGLPGPGDVIRYDIHIDEFFRQGETRLFRFRFEATVAGEPLMSMRDGCAGFFTEAELAAGKGIVHVALDRRPIPGKRPSDWVDLAPMAVGSCDDEGLDALRRGDYAAAFGPAFEGLGLSRPIGLPSGRMTLLHRVLRLDPTGGRYGLGQIQGELDIHPDDWFLTCHFVDDQVMPGTLMYECCLHTLRVYLLRMGWVAESPDVAYEPVPGVASRLKCRGQVTASTRSAVFEISIKELGYGPEPYAIADALMLADGRPVVEVIDMSIRMTGLTREDVERIWRGRNDEKPSARPAPLYGPERIRAFAEGKPSEAFGDKYLPFDSGRVIARLPRVPYAFLDRIVAAGGEPWVMQAGGSAVGEYDVPPDAWYFEANRGPSMPFAVLLEIPLQVCGWLSAYAGSALTDEQDLKYRNLGGEGTMFVDVTPETGTLTSAVKMTKVSRSAGMVIQHFDIETRAGETLVYRGKTYFGFFRKEALENQVGIREATPYQPSPAELQRARSLDFPARPPFPDGRLRMVARVETFVADGGPEGLGHVVGTLPVDPSAWFFEAHFYQDPVVPGSLGLESLLQLLKFVAVERWGDPAPRAGGPGFEPMGLGVPHRWIYRGQVAPRDRLVRVEAVVTAIDDARRSLRADGWLSVDGRLIYQMNEFTLHYAR